MHPRICFIGAAWVALVAFAGCGRKSSTATTQAVQPPPLTVRAASVVAEDIPSRLEITGSVRAVERAMLAARLMGAIEEMPVTLGQRVRAGEVLVKIAAGEMSARVAQARTQLETARRDLQRERELQTQGATPAESVRSLQDRVTTAEAQLREAEVLLGYALLRAPFDGTIAQKLANQGDLATPGTALVEVQGDGAFEIEATVPETMASGLTLGSEVGVTIPSTGVVTRGRMAEISFAADTRTRSIPVKISVARDSGVRSGQFARLEIPGRSRRALLVPFSAVSTIGQMERVFVVSENRAVLRLVRTGPRVGDRIELLAGVNEGERVVLEAPAGLQDGQPLGIRP